MTTIKVSKNATKAEEIAFLESVANSVESGSYLSSFFRKELVEWATSQIHSDFPPDVWDYWKSEQKDAFKLADEARKAIAELAELQKKFEAFKAQSEGTIKNLQDLRDGYLQQNRDLQTRNTVLVDELEVREEKAAQEAARKDAEIIRLKAMIFDLEHK